MIAETVVTVTCAHRVWVHHSWGLFWVAYPILCFWVGYLTARTVR